MGKDEANYVRMALANRDPIPDNIVNAPRLQAGLDFYYRAFGELNTCRGFGFQAGPIPWTAIQAFASTYEIFGVDFFRFQTLIRAMDVAYLNYADKANKKKTIEPSKSALQVDRPPRPVRPIRKPKK